MNSFAARRPRSVFRSVLIAALTAIVIGCGSSATSSSSSTSSTSESTSSVYPAAYKAAGWASNVTVTYPSSCSLTITSNGQPATHSAYYLGPSSTSNPTVVATTPVSHLQLALWPYSGYSFHATSATVNICPTAASSTSSTQLGAIGFLLTGVPLYNAYEATNTPALSDNVSYTFTDSNGVSQTASFLDSCASHGAPSMANPTSVSWHYHGLPSCVTSLVDTSTGPSHLIGFALDGYPIYGGRDINGNVITVAQLDACNGITSVTPEFSTATYHYVLPIGVTTAQSSLPCYHGSVSAQVAEMARKYACRMPGITTAGVAVPPLQAQKRNMPGM